MLFLIRGDYIDPGALLPPEQTFDLLEQVVVPSFQILAQLAEQGKVRGGIFPGERSGSCLVEVDSYEELDSLMNHLPFFGLVRWDVKPVMPFASIAAQLPGYIRDARQQMPPAR